MKKIVTKEKRTDIVDAMCSIFPHVPRDELEVAVDNEVCAPVEVCTRRAPLSDYNLSGEIQKEYIISYPTKEISATLEVALTEFMSAVFSEYYKWSKLLGQSTDITLTCENPQTYRIILTVTNNPMHAVRFDSFMKKVFELGKRSGIFGTHIHITLVEDEYITNVDKNTVNELIDQLSSYNEGKKKFIIKKPLATKKFTSDELYGMGLVGLYSHGKCTCKNCVPSK